MQDRKSSPIACSMDGRTDERTAVSEDGEYILALLYSKFQSTIFLAATWLTFQPDSRVSRALTDQFSFHVFIVRVREWYTCPMCVCVCVRLFAIRDAIQLLLTCFAKKSSLAEANSDFGKLATGFS